MTLDRTRPDVNLGISDGEVPHAEINLSIAGADKVVLFGGQTRLPHFPEDRRLPRLHAGEPQVLFLWRVLTKVPENLRAALIEGPISITLVRGDTLLHFRDFRCHQAVHIGRRRRTIYLPEILLQQAEEKGYNHWSIAEGIIFASWMLLDYLLLADVLTAYGERAANGGRAASHPGLAGTNGHNGHEPDPDGPETTRWNGLRLSEPLLRRLTLDHNHHRRPHPEPLKSEVEEFIAGYRAALIRVEGVNALSREPWEIAREVFDPGLETRWSKDKMERIADIFQYPKMFLFDRDIIHGAALELARRKGQTIEATSFADALHDYRDALRFDPRPLMTEFCRGIVPKPRAVFVQTIVDLGVRGLRGFLLAYRDGELEALDLVHPLWMYLVSLSSDPAGVFARIGKCRALCRPAEAKIAGGSERAPAAAVDSAALDCELAGILVRLDRLPGYRHAAAQILELGDVAREELLAVVASQGLEDADEWATFKMKKQAIVACACELLDRLDGDDGDRGGVSQLVERRRIHEDEEVRRLLADNPHRLTSDPSAVLMYTRSYHRTLAEFGPADPDSNSLLASILVRLDQSPDYERLLGLIPTLGPPAVSALYDVLDHVSERDERRRPILDQARRMLGRILLEKQLRSRARQRARQVGSVVSPAAPEATGQGAGVADSGEAFVGLHRELLTGTAFLERGAAGAATDDDAVDGTSEDGDRA